MGDYEVLTSLEALLSEFFGPTTSNARKREIEVMLENFTNHRDAWRHCLLFLQTSQNQYVMMFTLTSLENIINRQWITLPENERVEIRVTLWNELMSKHEVLPNFIKNKLAALMVSIARYDWPHLYPEFLNDIVKLVRGSGHMCLIGLTLAQFASEELGSGREVGVLLPSARRSQLERLMLKGSPHLLSALAAILERNANKEGQNPPPSPTSGAPNTSTLPDLLANAHDIQPADKALEMEIVVKCLTSLQHLFSWLPLSSHVPPSLVTSVFYWGSIATQTQSMDAALAGLGGVCEVLYRRYAPPGAGATALRLHHAAHRLLRALSTLQNHQRPPHPYLLKLSEFLKLFVSLHFKRLEAEPEFDALEFLSYLFQFTFQAPNCAIFVSCLDIWIQFIDILKPEDTPKYWEALQALVNSILNKIQFQHNKQQLQHLDNEVCDDDGETEWQTFLKHCIECIARIADLAPLDVFTAVLERWQGLAGVYARSLSRGGPISGASSGADADRLLAALLDLATLTRLLGRLAPHLLAETDAIRRGECLSRGCALVERLSAALAGAALVRPMEAIPQPHRAVHAEMFACMGAWVCYANECGVTTPAMEALFTSALPYLLPKATTTQEPPLLTHAAAHLLLSLSKNMKFVNDPIPLVGELFSHSQRSLAYLDPKTAGVVREALLQLSLRSGAAGGECARLLLAAWTRSADALPALTHLLYAFADAPTPAKRIIAKGVSELAQQALELLREGRDSDGAMSDLFLALLTTLMPQLGDFAYSAIDAFLQTANRAGDERSMERVVECVRLGVEGAGGGGGGAGGVRVRAVLELCRHARSAPGLQRPAAALMHSVLIHRWRYFFPNKCDEEESAQRTEEFRQAFQSIGASLLLPDIELLRINIDALHTLNTKWKLYHKVIFRSEFLAEFLTVMLSSLAEGGTRNLLKEEMLQEIHAMASVDFTAFRSGFLPHFLHSIPGLTAMHADHLAQFPPDTDLPTFTQNIQRMINDLNCYHTYNALPPISAYEDIAT